MTEPTSSAARRHARKKRRETTAAVLFVLVILGALYASFIREVPLTKHHDLRAVFASANQLHPGSDARIAGLHVGTVQKVAAGPHNTAIVTIRLGHLPMKLRRDLSLSIVPRLALEGNYYVRIEPGSSDAPVLDRGTLVPESQTSVPVQLDQVLDTFDLPTRQALNASVADLSSGLGRSPRGGPSGFDGLRRAITELDGSLGDLRTVARAVQGTHPGDLHRSIRSTADVVQQLASDPRALDAFVVGYSRVFGALADSDRALASGITALDDLSRTAPARLAAINAATPAVVALADAAGPALRTLPGGLRSGTRLLAQVRGLLSRRELGSVVPSLRPTSRSLPVLNRRLGALFPFVGSATGCVNKTVVPTLNATVPDGSLTSGPLWKDLLHLAANLAGASSASDGNGTAIRLGVVGSEQVVTTAIPGLGNVVSRGADVDGARPAALPSGVDPPLRPDQPCIEQAPPDLGARNAGAAPAATPVRRGPLDLAERLMARALLQPTPGRLRQAFAALRVDWIRNHPLLRRRPDPRPVVGRHPLPVGRPQPLPAISIKKPAPDAVGKAVDNVVTTVDGLLGDVLPKLGLPLGGKGGSR